MSSSLRYVTMAGGVASAAALGLAAGVAFAADPLGTIANNVLGNLDETLKLGTVFIFVVGFLLVGVGCFMIWRIGRHQGMHAPATVLACALAVVSGALMVYHSTVIGVGGATIFGSSAGDVTILGTTQVR